MELRWSPYLTPLNWNIPGRWFPHGKAGGKLLRCDMFECAPHMKSLGWPNETLRWPESAHWGCGGERKRVSQRKVGEFDAYFDFSHSHFPLKLACLKGYLAGSTFNHRLGVPMSPLDIFGVISPPLLFESYRFIEFLPLHICTHIYYIYMHIDILLLNFHRNFDLYM